jgi:hypothetical protein
LKAQNSPFLRDREQPNYPFGLNDVFCAGGQQLNVNTAPVDTLKLIPGIDETAAADWVHNRAGPDGQDGNEDDAPANSPQDMFSGRGQYGGPGSAVPPGLNVTTLLGTRSAQFEVTVNCEINGYAKTYTGILRRNANQGKQNDWQILQFWWK